MADNFEFRFCIYMDKQSVQNCTSGKLSSLLPEYKTCFLRALVLDTGHSSVDTDDMHEDLITLSEPQNKVSTELVISICVAVLLLIALIGMFSYRLRRAFKKIWKRNAMITIPNIDIEPEMEILNASTLQKNGLPELKGMLSENEEENEALLQYMTVSNQSLSSEDTFYEYDVSSKSQSHENIDNSNTKGNETSWESMLQLNKNTFDMTKIKASKETATKPDTCDCKTVLNSEYEVKNENIVQLTSPDRKNDTDESFEDQTIVQTVEKGTNIEYTRYDWDQIFLFMIRELIDAREYKLFFHMLFGEMGVENAGRIISYIEMDTSGTTTKVFQLLQYWKQGVGCHINPKDIERAFEKIGWNIQLQEFNKYMKKPPLLPDNSRWNEPRISSQNTRHPHCGNAIQMPLMMKCYEQQLSLPEQDVDVQSSEELSFQRNRDGNDIVESYNIIGRRRKLVLNKTDDHDVNTSRSKYKRVENDVKDNRNENRKKRRKCAKIQSSKRNKSFPRLDNRAVPSSSSSTTTTTTTSAGSGPLDSGYNTCSTSCSWTVSSSDHSTMSGLEGKHKKIHKRGVNNFNENAYRIKKKRTSKNKYIPKWQMKKIVLRNKTLINENYRKTSYLLKHIEKNIQSNLAVDRYEYDIYIKDIVNRLTQRPTSHDILTMKMQSYLNADTLHTQIGERVHAIYCGEHLLLLREKEWTSIQIYVEHARTELVKRRQSSYSNDFLFLDYDGGILHDKLA